MADEKTKISPAKLQDSFQPELVSALREVVEGSSWQLIGRVSDFSGTQCTVLYPDDPSHENVAVFFVGKNGVCEGERSLFAIDTICPHEGGPLELGDIEDLDGYPTVFCPWHHYDFNLKTGESSTGLQQQTYEVQVVGSEVYINIDVELSRKPNSDQASDETNIRKTELSPDAIAPRPSSDTLCNWAVTILCTPDPEKKENAHHLTSRSTPKT
ncbi:uncharacterized protein LOC5521875 isoform X2 [Nematostella vectensis]|uniref:uncharacterized protein LOC5521875 isoform X2 n=1 Tax=Nematostella vectensis TaxID=45351 RepID=UPI0020776B0D|nr:uncharacterized protein LOC5521875 isoform X2 [Nematostella vectensis]